MDRLPLIDLRAAPDEVARGIGEACRAHGFFYVVGHGIDESLGQRLEDLSHRFFALPETTKERFAMPLGGRAWRGWFPLGGELTSGRPDWKEGLYLGTELDDDHPRVMPGVPLHGRNLIPGDDVLPGLRQTILEWMPTSTALGHRVMQGIAGSLDLPADYFAQPLHRRPAHPLSHLPATRAGRSRKGSTSATASASTPTTACSRCCARTVGGLQVHAGTAGSRRRPCRESFVCNIGDMLDRMTGGLYRVTPHRVRLNASGRDRLSFPLFFDPDFDARIAPIRSAATDDHATRWDGASVTPSRARYGDYVLGKVGKVFPELRRELRLGAASAAPDSTAIRRHDAGVAEGPPADASGAAAQVDRIDLPLRPDAGPAFDDIEVDDDGRAEHREVVRTLHFGAVIEDAAAHRLVVDDAGPALQLIGGTRLLVAIHEGDPRIHRDGANEVARRVPHPHRQLVVADHLGRAAKAQHRLAIGADVGEQHRALLDQGPIDRRAQRLPAAPGPRFGGGGGMRWICSVRTRSPSKTKVSTRPRSRVAGARSPRMRTAAPAGSAGDQTSARQAARPASESRSAATASAPSSVLPSAIRLACGCSKTSRSAARPCDTARRNRSAAPRPRS